LYLVREGTLTEIKADKMSTGIVSRDSSIVQYTNNTYEFKKGDMIYMFSDGFPDQKGEKTRKKFYYQPFKDLLVSIHQLTVQQQKMELDTTICQWMGGIEQTDDILIMGIRV
jgi:serine phosphatase RsbU (regulator of sigma subunit)